MVCVSLCAGVCLCMRVFRVEMFSYAVQEKSHGRVCVHRTSVCSRHVAYCVCVLVSLCVGVVCESF